MEMLGYGTSMHMPLGEAAVRLGVALALGGVVGLERELRGKVIGLRTFMITAVGAAAFAILALELLAFVEETAERSMLDLSRVVQGIIEGIGFLGAGAIIHQRGSVRGATTGAGVWFAGAVGTAAGFGYFSLALLLAAIALVVLGLLGGLTGLIGSARE